MSNGSHLSSAGEDANDTGPAEEADLRVLLHCLQRERGSTCAMVASGGTQPGVGTMVRQFRGDTDMACGADGLPLMRVAGAAIERQRAKVDELFALGGSCKGHELGRSFYDTLVGYTAIIGGVLAEVEARFERRFEYQTASTLSSLSRLKECTALVRGFLMGITSLLPEGVPGLPPNAFAHLVIVTHQQRAHVLTLNASAPANLVPIVRTCYSLDSPQLAEIQWKLESEFDVHELRRSLSVMQCWQLYTDHIEKLRKAEVDVAVQVEKDARFSRRQRRQISSTIVKVMSTLYENANFLTSGGGGGNGEGGDENGGKDDDDVNLPPSESQRSLAADLAGELRGISPEQLKRELLKSLHIIQHGNESSPSAIPRRRVGPRYKEPKPANISPSAPIFGSTSFGASPIGTPHHHPAPWEHSQALTGLQSERLPAGFMSRPPSHAGGGGSSSCGSSDTSSSKDRSPPATTHQTSGAAPAPPSEAPRPPPPSTATLLAAHHLSPPLIPGSAAAALAGPGGFGRRGGCCGVAQRGQGCQQRDGRVVVVRLVVTPCWC